MNTKELAKLFDRLTPRERLALILAAAARVDEAERKRLSTSASEETHQVPNYYGLAKTLSEAVHYHMLTLLDLAAEKLAFSPEEAAKFVRLETDAVEGDDSSEQ